MFWLLSFTFFILILTGSVFAATRLFAWWLLLLIVLPPWGWYGYRYVYVPRYRELGYREIETENLKRVRFDLEQNTIHTLT